MPQTSHPTPGPCAALFHGALTPASVAVLAAHPERLNPFSEDEREGEFAKHLTGAEVLADADGQLAANAARAG